LTPSLARLALQAFRKRSLGSGQLLSAAFDKQREVISDPSRFKAVSCARRSGKTFGAAIYMFKVALENPGCNVLYLAKTTSAGKQMILKDVFNVLNERFKLGLAFNLSDLTMRFPNGSVIKIMGADANVRQIHKVVGGKFKLAVIDESQYWTSQIREIVEEGLEPGRSDQDGTIVMLGVPVGPKGFFYRAFKGLVPGWAPFKWHATDNPHQKEAYERALALKQQLDPLFLETATFKQQWLGEWVDDFDQTCYRFDPGKNRLAHVPGSDPEANDFKRAWKGDHTFICGLDIGFHDAMAWVVMCYRDDGSDRTLYVVDTFKQAEMSLDDVEAKCVQLATEWPITAFVVDPANSNVFEELRSRLSVPLLKAEKNPKVAFIRLMGDDMQTKKIVLVGDRCEPLSDEWQALSWDVTNPAKPKPDPSAEDHLADAALYGWRHCYHYLKTVAPSQSLAKTDAQRVEEHRRRANRPWDDPERQAEEADPFRDWEILSGRTHDR